jgi:hypothetical protein
MLLQEADSGRGKPVFPNILARFNQTFLQRSGLGGGEAYATQYTRALQLKPSAEVHFEVEKRSFTVQLFNTLQLQVLIQSYGLLFIDYNLATMYHVCLLVCSELPYSSYQCKIELSE